MDTKVIAVIAVVAVVAVSGGIAAAVLMGNSGGKDNSPDDASKIAAAFSKDYSGFYGKNFYLEDGETKEVAKDSYSNGSTSGYGSTSNYVKFYVFDSKDKAKEDFDTNKADYEKQIGTSAMGAEKKGTYEKAELDDAIGYYSNVTMSSSFTYLYYTGYYKTAFFECYFYIPGGSTTDEAITALSTAIDKAIKNPVSVDEAKRFTDALLKAQNAIFTGESFGDHADATFSLTEDSTKDVAKIVSSEKPDYYIEVKKIAGGAKAEFDTLKADIQSGIGGTAMGATKIGIYEKTGADDGLGWYYNASSKNVRMIHYGAYKGDFMVLAHIRAELDITDEQATWCAKSLIADICFEDSALKASRMTYVGDMFGNHASATFSITEDSTKDVAKIVSSEKVDYYIEVKKIAGGAKAEFDTLKADIQSGIGGTAMGATKIGITAKGAATDGLGWYYNASSVKMIHYGAYFGDYLVLAHIRSDADNNDSTVTTFAEMLTAMLVA